MRTIGVGLEDRTRAARALRTTEVAWLAVLPCTLATIVLVVLLGPPFGHAFLGPGPERFWAVNVPGPEPVEHGRFLLSLLGPAALVAIVLASARWTPRADAALARRAILATQALLVAFAVVCFAAQYDLVVSAYLPEAPVHVRYFTIPTLLVALLAPALLLALLRRRELAERARRLARETPARRVGAALAAALLTATWMLTAVFADGSLANAPAAVVANLPPTLSEPFAILGGRTPFVDFNTQYGHLVPYLSAGTMSLFGASIGTFTITMATASGLALLAIYAVLHRVTRSSLLALLLYAPFLATSLFMESGTLANRYSPASLFSLWPIRYGGPYLLAWLLARHVDGAGPRRTWVLFALAGLVLVNNPEFGAGAVAALVVALVAVRPPRSRADAGRQFAEAAAGLLGAVALLAALTLISAGALPRLHWAFEFDKLYGIDGWSMVPLPRIGIFYLLYVTFAAELAVAAVRLVRREQDVLLTAMLAWSGTFGLLTGAYFVGRSHPEVLINLFSSWALGLVLLTIATARALAARGWRRPTPAECAVLFGFGLAVCSLAQAPTPWSQISRIRDREASSILKQAASVAFVAERTRPGEPIAILIPLGHRIAYDAGRVDVAPYPSIQSIGTREQLDATIEALRREGGDKLYISDAFISGEVLDALHRVGFAETGRIPEGSSVVSELVDRRS